MKYLHIAGKWTPAADEGTSQTINPFDATPLETLAEASPADVDAAVAAAREAFDDGPWRRSTITERTALLGKIADLLQRDREQLAHTESLDTGKTLNEARADVDDTTAVFRYYAGMAGSQAGRVVDPGRPGVVSRITHEPVGVCALIAPWNYPLLQISWKLAPALAAGNTTVAKPSELTPLSTVALVGLFEEAGVPPGVVNLLLGQGGTVGQALVAHPGVDLISFTGGLATGERIMAAAAHGVRRVALELGGKNPNIVFDDTDFDTVVDNALTAAFLHSGQVCSAGARLIVQDSLHDSFVAELAARADRIRLGSGLDPDTECGPLISEAHRAKVERYIALGLAEGASLRAGGQRPSSSVAGPGLLPAADGVRRLPPGDGGGAGRGVRAGGDRRAVQHRGRGDPARQRHRVRPGGRGVDFGRGPGRAGRGRAAPRHGMDQRLPPLPAAGGVGRLRQIRHRPRARSLGPGGIHREEAHLPQHEPGPRALVLRV